MTREKWLVRTQDEATVRKLCDEHGISATVARLLCNRSITDFQEIENFLHASPDSMHDPMLLPDINPFLNRLRQAIRNGEHITVYGDYDVDGITSTVIMIQFLSDLTQNLDYYIPSRLNEGYGLNKEAIDTLKAKGTDLIITVDTGTTATEEVRYCKELGIDILVTDHHECKDELPDCPVVNPKRHDSAYPFQNLAGVGVAFKVICAFLGDSNVALNRFCIPVAIGTIADIMPMFDENRAIVIEGLKRINLEHPIGLKSLLHACSADEGPIDCNTIAYRIAPHLNAAGRVGNSKTSVDLLLETNSTKADAFSRELCDYNTLRKEKEQQVVHDIDLRLAGKLPHDKIIIDASESWHNGAIGIAASRVTEQYFRPCILLCKENGKEKGSARSVKGVNLFELVSQVSDLLENFGGHEMAVGMTLKEENHDEFVRRLTELANAVIPDEALIPSFEAEFETGTEALTEEFIRDYNRLSPFGGNNPQPQFYLPCCTIKSVTGIGGGHHTKFLLTKDATDFSAVLFSTAPEETDCSSGDKIDLIFTPSLKTYHGRQSLNITVKSIRFSDDKSDTSEEHYLNFRTKGIPLPEDCKITRDDMVTVFRYLSSQADTAGDIRLFPRSAIRSIRTRTGIRFNLCRILLCVDTLISAGILEKAENSHYTIRKTTQKINLTVLPEWQTIAKGAKN